MSPDPLEMNQQLDQQSAGSLQIFLVLFLHYNIQWGIFLESSQKDNSNTMSHNIHFYEEVSCKYFESLFNYAFWSSNVSLLVI